VDRLRGLGNSIVPQIAQWIAERIKDAELTTPAAPPDPPAGARGAGSSTEEKG